MGNIVGIISTVILVSTLVTLVFAVIAYIGARRQPKKSGTPKHAGDYPVPERAVTPELPAEFVLRMHDVHSYTSDEKPPEGALIDSRQTQKPATATVRPPASGTSAFTPYKGKPKAVPDKAPDRQEPT